MTGLEDLALQQRLDIVASQARVQFLTKALRLTESSALVGSVLVGGATMRDASGMQQAGPTLVLELLVFNRRQGQIESLRAALRQARHHARQLRVSALSHVRRSQRTVLTSRAMVEPFAEALMPLRRRITDILARKMDTNDTGAWFWLVRPSSKRSAGGSRPSATTGNLEYAVGTDLNPARGKLKA